MAEAEKGNEGGAGITSIVMKHTFFPFRLTAMLFLFGALTLELEGQSMSITKFHSRKTAGGEPGFLFGFEVNLNERWMVISEPAFKVGAVHVFDTTTRQHRRVILDPLAPANTEFGVFTALEGDRLLVGAPGAGTVGRVYLFDVRTGVLLRTIHAPSANNTEFGVRLAWTGSTSLHPMVRWC